MTGIVGYVPDLMDRSRISAVADVTFVDHPRRLGDVDARLVVVDLTRPGVLDALGAVRAPVIGFANHTERRLLEAAREAGCGRVLARSAFFANLPELLADG